MNRPTISANQAEGFVTTADYKMVVEKAEQALVAARENLNDVRRNRSILCSCSSFHKICELELIVTHWYVEPYSCTEGDYWVEGEWNFMCPDTGMRNRLHFDDYMVAYDQRDRAGIAAEPTFKQIYRRLFKSSRSVHEHYIKGNFYENRFIDSQRELFELPAKPVKSK